MLKSVATLIGVLAVLALLAPAAQAGASASAPSKYAKVAEPAAGMPSVRLAKRIKAPITDFSASARTASFRR